MAKVLFFFLIMYIPLSGNISAQGELYWVMLKDKILVSAPAPPAVVLQTRPQPGITWYGDLPLNPEYLNALRFSGFRIRAQSRWMNSVVLELREDQIQEVQNFPFVDNIQAVRKLRVSSVPEPHNAGKNSGALNAEDLSSSFWAYGTRQLSMLNGDLLHINRFTGKGVKLAVFDNGFPGVNQLQGFRDTKILATRDFVADEEDVYNNTGSHGTMVLSTMGAYQPGRLVGTAFEADYILAVTENDMSESLQEEYNWVQAAEWADSLGAQIFNTSLGYTVFDDSTEDHQYSDLNGNTTVITRAADAAAARGILVFNSAGNEGNSAWRYISAPADGDSVFAVGSVNKLRSLSSFSSRGPSADGRIKPDMLAMGEGTAVLTSSGEIQLYNGTSFSSPVLAGLAASLMQAVQDVPAYTLGIALRESGHTALMPDNDQGYGIPDAAEAYKALSGKELFRPTQAEILVYPNPASVDVNITVVFPGKGKDMRLEIWDMQGKRVMDLNLVSGDFLNRFVLRGNYELSGIPGGVYFLRFTDTEESTVLGYSRLRWR